MDNISHRNRNYCIDLVKGIACICVVFMHCEFPGMLGMMVQTISRFSVPFFFMVSGFFCYREYGVVNYSKKVKHITIITIISTIFYLIITPLYSSGVTISMKSIICWVLFNQPVYIAGQLWFLFALLYDYVLFALFEKLKLRKIASVIIPVGIVAYILLAQGSYLLGHSLPNMFYRNWLVEGLLFFILGYWIHEHQSSIKISNKILILVVVCFTILCTIERILIGRDFGVNISTFPQVTAMFLLCVNNPDFGRNSLLSKLGGEESMYVYIIHPAIWHVLELVIEKNSIVIQYVFPVLVLLLAIIVSVIVFKTFRIIREKNVFKKVCGNGNNNTYI